MELKEIYRSLIRLHILIEATRRPLDSAGVSATLQDRGFKLSAVSVWRILRGFETAGYLKSTPARNSRPRSVYTITAAGRKRALDASKRVEQLIEILGAKELLK